MTLYSKKYHCFAVGYFLRIFSFFHHNTAFFPIEKKRSTKKSPYRQKSCQYELLILFFPAKAYAFANQVQGMMPWQGNWGQRPQGFNALKKEGIF
ncbi:hypothetical protein [Anaerotignum sp.]